MKTTKIWLSAMCFGIISSGILYLSLFTSQSPTDAQTKYQEETSTQVNIEQPGEPITQLKIGEGMRAISVAVEEAEGVAGFLSPGSYVDVVSLLPGPNGEVQAAKMLLQNVKVLAVGNTVENPGENSDATGSMGLAGEGEGSSYRTVTLEVKPEQGTSLAYANVKGDITFMLRATESSAKVPSQDASNEEVISK